MKKTMKLSMAELLQQKKVDTNARFVIGAGAVLATLVAVLQVVPPILKVLTPQSSAVSMTEMVMDLSELS